jgi:hypothetical protein
MAAVRAGFGPSPAEPTSQPGVRLLTQLVNGTPRYVTEAAAHEVGTVLD